MKNYVIILLFIVLGSCSRKTHIAKSAQLETKIKLTKDSSARTTLNGIDKTITFISKTIDTNIIVSGRTLNGYLPSPNFKNDTSARFENEDLSVILSVDKLGFARFAAEPKSKKIPVKIHERIEIYNDVSTNQTDEVQTKTAASTTTTLKEKHSEKQNIPSVRVWFFVVLAIVSVVVFIRIARKFDLLKILG